MHIFNSVHHLEGIIKSATCHCHSLNPSILSAEYHKRLIPIVLVDYGSDITVPQYAHILPAKARRIHYCQKFLTAFLCTTEYSGDDGNGMYGIGMYRKWNTGWGCDSILFDEKTGEPLLIKGRDAAMQCAADEARLLDKSIARENEKSIVANGLMEASVLNAILGALMRAETEEISAVIGIRAGKIALLLDDDTDGGRALCVPRTGFVCRDQAAGAVFHELAYLVDSAALELRRRTEERQAA